MVGDERLVAQGKGKGVFLASILFVDTLRALQQSAHAPCAIMLRAKQRSKHCYCGGFILLILSGGNSI